MAFVSFSNGNDSTEVDVRFLRQRLTYGWSGEFAKAFMACGHLDRGGNEALEESIGVRKVVVVRGINRNGTTSRLTSTSPRFRDKPLAL